MKIIIIFLILPIILIADDLWKGTFIQDDDYIKMYYTGYDPKLGKVRGSACLYEFTLSQSEATIKVLDTFGLVVIKKGTVLCSTKDTKTIVVIDSIFQCTYLYNLYPVQKFGVMFWTRATIIYNMGTIQAETYPLKLLTN